MVAVTLAVPEFDHWRLVRFDIATKFSHGLHELLSALAVLRERHEVGGQAARGETVGTYFGSRLSPQVCASWRPLHLAALADFLFAMQQQPPQLFLEAEHAQVSR